MVKFSNFQTTPFHVDVLKIHTNWNSLLKKILWLSKNTWTTMNNPATLLRSGHSQPKWALSSMRRVSRAKSISKVSRRSWNKKRGSPWKVRCIFFCFRYLPDFFSGHQRAVGEKDCNSCTSTMAWYSRLEASWRRVITGKWKNSPQVLAYIIAIYNRTYN